MESDCGIIEPSKIGIFSIDWKSNRMIILITGASHTGKTALAQKLLEKYKYPYLSIDHLNSNVPVRIFGGA